MVGWRGVREVKNFLRSSTFANSSSSSCFDVNHIFHVVFIYKVVFNLRASWFWGCLHFWGCHNFWGHHQFWGGHLFWGHHHFLGHFLFEVVFIFEVVNIVRSCYTANTHKILAIHVRDLCSWVYAIFCEKNCLTFTTCKWSIGVSFPFLCQSWGGKYFNFLETHLTLSLTSLNLS